MPGWRWLSLLTAVAFAIRAWLSTIFQLNPDEAMQLNAAVSGQWFAYHHPPLLLWWLSAASQVSEANVWLRLAPSLAGALTPAAAFLWTRRFLSQPTSWMIAVFLAFCPATVLISAQIRGYALLVTAALLSLALLDSAFETGDPRRLAGHFLCLYLAILSEFHAAILVLAVGCYGVCRLLSERDSRRLAGIWICGNVVAAGIYAWLYQIQLAPLIRETDSAQLIADYLSPGFPQPGQSPLAFAGISSLGQLAFLGGSRLKPAPAFAAFALLGLWSWLRRQDWRWILLAIIYGVSIAVAIAEIYPFGMFRHSMLIGVVSLAAVGAGVDWFARRRIVLGLAVFGSLLILGFSRLESSGGLPAREWRKPRVDAAIERMFEKVPPGATVVTDYESLQLFQAFLLPPNDRARVWNRPAKMLIRGREFVGIHRSSIINGDRQPTGTWIAAAGVLPAVLAKNASRMGAMVIEEETEVLTLVRVP